ncbi:hypothetical protein M976_00290 [Buttiauxella ferragutiae ATCC 51602]|jgi:hypothetical protein|uniref:Uncharacterized protein n=1 Tax=Buttiauxella ferragutiae ATCC 51602 TaxID=1354252 RepID=A0ABX2WDV9_9ENTR|nr:hypothetical protein M976_00290 [Buttiauxella ferragutiae ATCC 51602]
MRQIIDASQEVVKEGSKSVSLGRGHQPFIGLVGLIKAVETEHYLNWMS